MFKKIISLILLLSVFTGVFLTACVPPSDDYYTPVYPRIYTFNIEFDFDKVYNITEPIVFKCIFNYEKDVMDFTDKKGNHSSAKYLQTNIRIYNYDLNNQFGKIKIIGGINNVTIHADTKQEDFTYSLELTVQDSLPNYNFRFSIGVYNLFENGSYDGTYSYHIRYKVYEDKIAFIKATDNEEDDYTKINELLK